MQSLFKTSLSIALITLISGCSGKSFTMQDYADKWFNNKEETSKKLSTSESKTNQTVTQTPESNTIQTKETEQKEVVETKEPVTKAQTTQEVVKTSKVKKVEGAAIRKGVPSQVAWSSMNKHKDGQMQKSLNKWTKEEWNPTFKGDIEQTKKDEEASEHFTLQHYMDKRAKYLKDEEARYKASGEKEPEANYEKMDKLPVIGK